MTTKQTKTSKVTTTKINRPKYIDPNAILKDNNIAKQKNKNTVIIGNTDSSFQNSGIQYIG